MARTKIPFVDFYSKHGIIPTRQDISDLRRHIDRRESLYRQLGLPAAFFRGASVLEFGPGSGHNAIVTGLHAPARYLLVDGNPPSIKSTRDQLRKHCPSLKFQIKKSSITSFRTSERFDLVLAEGLIPTQNDPAKFLRHVATFVKPSGVVAFTTMDAVSLLPEMLRRWTAWQLTHKLKDINAKVRLLVDFFADDVKSLPGMSRPTEDWVLDQILHPWSGPLFSIPEAVRALGGRWALLGSSPRFLCDWRWYKNVHGKAAGNNDFAIQSYYENAHNLIDFRHTAAPLPVRENQTLESAAHAIYQLTFRQEHTGRSVPGSAIAAKAAEIARIIRKVSPKTSQALAEFQRAARSKDLINSDFGDFRKLWGRGQQYLSFTRI